RVIGAGNHRPLSGKSRSQYVACLEGATVRGRSALIEFDGHLLRDVQDDEFEALDDEVEWDPSVFRSDGRHVWHIEHAEPDPPIQLEEAFTLLGVHTDFFGHWMWEYLPKYGAARQSKRMPDVPVLIDAHMPKSHRQSLEVLFGAASPLIE